MATVSDNFDRADGALATPWTQPFSRMPQISGAKVVRNATGDSWAHHNTTALSNDRYVQARVSRLSGGSAELVVRRDDTTPYGRLRVSISTNLQVYGGSSDSLRGTVSGNTDPWVRLEASGSGGVNTTIRLLTGTDGVNWTERWTGADTTGGAVGGRVGLGVTSDTDPESAWIDDWSAGDLAAAPEDRSGTATTLSAGFDTGTATGTGARSGTGTELSASFAFGTATGAGDRSGAGATLSAGFDVGAATGSGTRSGEAATLSAGFGAGIAFGYKDAPPEAPESSDWYSPSLGGLPHPWWRRWGAGGRLW